MKKKTKIAIIVGAAAFGVVLLVRKSSAGGNGYDLPGSGRRRSTPSPGEVDYNTVESSPAAIYFLSGSKALTDNAKAKLDDYAASFRSWWGTARVYAVGHSDSRGSEADNMSLSEERARTVARYLNSAGVRSISHSGVGEANPVGDNATAVGRAMNRRVDLTMGLAR